MGGKTLAGRGRDCCGFSRERRGGRHRGDEGSGYSVHWSLRLQLERFLCRWPYGLCVGNFEFDAQARRPVFGSFNMAQPLDIFRRGGKLLRRSASRLQLHAAEPFRHRRRGRCIVSELSESSPASPLAAPRILTSADARRGNLQRDGAASGTVRGRIGYAPGSRLFYATGGFAWTYNRLTLTHSAPARPNAVFVAVGLGGGRRRRGADCAHWTARLEYLFTDYGTSGTTFFAGAAVRFRS